ncbi:MAG TPA: FGGY family carbohydrate kinase, partial [Methylomirabilota bacterium]|nr:FGGY family carbohydrate kinase [Methylomirabilota bacterium]
MLVLALDVGTSSTRARCFDTAGRPVPGAEGRAAYESRITADGGAELDPDALLEAVARAVDNCLAGCGRRARDIGAAGASVFWHSLLGLDPGGAPLTPILTWADTRSAGAAAELRERLDPGQVHARTGAPLHSTFFPAKLGWLCRSQPDLFGRAARWCGFAEYLLERLTGAWRASVSMASGTGLMDQAAA